MTARRAGRVGNLTVADQEAIARAFGFRSADHMGDVCIGEAPTLLESVDAFRYRRVMAGRETLG